MDLIAVLRVAIRRWYVLVPALLLSGLIGFLASRAISPSYQTNGIIMVTSPYVDGGEKSARLLGNPYYDTRTTASVLAGLAASADVQEAVGKAGGTGTYLATLDSGRPVILVTVTGKTKDVTLATYRDLVKELSVRLTKLQDGKNIPQDVRVSVDDTLQPVDASTSTSNRLKALIATLALGFVVSVAACVYLDHRWQGGPPPRRRKKKDTAPAAKAEARTESADPDATVVIRKPAAADQLLRKGS